MSAEDVLAEHQINQWAQHDGWWGCVCDGDVKCDPQHQLDALKAAGYSVVELAATPAPPSGNPESKSWLRGWLSCLYAHGITPSPELLAST